MKSTPFIYVEFCRSDRYGEDMHSVIQLRWRLKDIPLAKRYLAAFKIAEASKYIYRRDRFYNFPNSWFTRKRVVNRINEALCAIEKYAPGTILDWAADEMDQLRMNNLHVYFERYRGPLARPTELYENAPIYVREAFDNLNLMIHRFEDQGFSGRSISGDPKVHISFGLNEKVKRYPLESEDYKLYSPEVEFGSWMTDYCEVGKSIYDIWRDGDEVVGAEAILPLRFYSADALIHFGKSFSGQMAEESLGRFYKWWDQNAEKLEKLGFKKDDPKNAIGSLRIADLDREYGSIDGLNEEQIVNLIGRHQWVGKVRTGTHSAKRATKSWPTHQTDSRG